MASDKLAIPTQAEPTKPRALRNWILGGCFFAFAAFLLAAWRVPEEHYAKLITSQLTSAASRAGVSLVLTEPHLAFPKLHANRAEAFIPHILSSFQLQDITLAAHPARLLRGEVALSLQAAVANGRVKAEAAYSAWSHNITGSSDLQDLKLASIVQLQAFGVEQGVGSASLAEATLTHPEGAHDSWGLRASRWTLNLRDVVKNQDTFLQLPKGMGGGFIAIPAFRSLNLSANGVTEGGAVKVTSLTIDSSLGHVSATASFEGMLSNSPMHIAGHIQLSEESAAKYGPFLPLVSGGTLSDSDKDFEFELSGTTKAPHLKLHR
jgi:hypothetical protein